MPSKRDYDLVVHLCFRDARLYSHKSPLMLQVVTKCFNTDPLELGVTLHNGATNTEL